MRSTVLVFEYVTGGGMIGQNLPASWAAEGLAMRRAITEDFAAVPGVRVVTTIDPGLPTEVPPGVDAWVMVDGQEILGSRATDADSIVLIAPETGGILAALTGSLARMGGRLIGSSARAVAFVGDKSRLAHHFVGHGVPSPLNRTIAQLHPRLPAEWDGPIVVKPRDGAGSVDTFVVRDGCCPSWVGPDRQAVAQPYLPGEPMSASFLVDVVGKPTLLAIGRQRIHVDGTGRISYQGGTIPSGLDETPEAVLGAIASVVGHLPTPNLRGFIGVDFLLDDQGRVTVLEINPRPTTSYVGLARLFPPGTIAGAWLAAVSGPLASTDWPDRLRLDRDHSPISFDADGTIHDGSGDDLR